MYKVTRSRIVRREDGERRVFEPGDTIEPRDNELERFGDNLELIETESDQSDDEESEGEDSEDGDDAEICGTEMSNGETCDRPAEECGYH